MATNSTDRGYVAAAVLVLVMLVISSTLTNDDEPTDWSTSGVPTWATPSPSPSWSGAGVYTLTSDSDLDPVQVRIDERTDQYVSYSMQGWPDCEYLWIWFTFNQNTSKENDVRARIRKPSTSGRASVPEDVTATTAIATGARCDLGTWS